MNCYYLFCDTDGIHYNKNKKYLFLYLTEIRMMDATSLSRLTLYVIRRSNDVTAVSIWFRFDSNFNRKILIVDAADRLKFKDIIKNMLMHF